MSIPRIYITRESGLYEHWIQTTFNTIRIKYPNIGKGIEYNLFDFNELSLKSIFDLFLLLSFGHLLSLICFVFEILIFIYNHQN